ncbi:hypothetical protein ACVBEH_34130, partial [Roseateles sp. GG27B]
MIHAAKLARQLRQAQTQTQGQPNGAAAPSPVDFAAVMARIQRVIADIAPHDSVERYTEMGVD